jgi:hypothetical protein
MTLLLENPWPAIFAGAAAELILLIALWATGRGRLLLAMAGVLAVTAGMVLLAWLVETDREKVAQTLRDAAKAFESNDADAVVQFVSPSAERLRRDVHSKMRIVTFRKVTLDSDIQIVIDDRADPPTAQASFGVMAATNVVNYPTYLDVWLRKENGRWQVYQYKDHGFREALRR